jgi:hypothetical protein
VVRARGWALTVVAVVAPACSSAADLGGVWRGDTAPSPLLHGPDQKTLGVELVIGQYGPDLAGVLRFYRSASFERARDAAAPDRECACLYLHAGHVDEASDKLSFTTKGCLPGTSPNAPVRVRGQFHLGQKGLLDGSLKVDEPASQLHGRQIDLSLKRTASQADTEAAELACVQPSTSAGGNVHSGL